ncbi:hypothetical protein AXF42_Ash009984 [Apostasia shenzhenica]|uniref:Uncharacterized protein n=1 Tax=Apostasia shenzhenica TaxID=1088818 RepID=A0A2I0ACI2_9ASPA|nr:hypothetical protein AXF42_Ash009984 [Apostasia shenzhenica]
MQRQSLGSPNSKLQIHDAAGGGDGLEKEDNRFVSPAAESAAGEEDMKAEKKLIMRSRPKTDRSIHLIPVLTLVCFLILYLCSHDPSPNDLASAVGFSALIHHRGITATATGRVLAAEKTGSSGLRTHRALEEAGRFRHRRLGDP